MPGEGGAASNPCAICETFGVPKLKSRGYWIARRSDWSHSSFHRFVAKGILPPDWGGDAGEVTGAFGE